MNVPLEYSINLAVNCKNYRMKIEIVAIYAMIISLSTNAEETSEQRAVMKELNEHTEMYGEPKTEVCH